jgi:vacuolar protein sorting-associated protein VTA1
MPGLVIPQELQKITPIIRRAEELDKNKDNAESQFVSYYCYQYAVLKGIGLAKSVDGKKVLGSLLSMLEGKKEAMSSFTRDEAKFLCLKFANSVFDKADMEDRAGAATDNTSRTFYAAGTFFEIMQQFYEDDDESEELAEIKKKQLYSKWKALEIRKALKAGEKPKPGGYAENQNAVYEEDNEQGGNNTKSGNVEMSKQDGGEMAIETDATVTVSIPSVESDSNNGDDEDDDGVEDLTPTISAAEALAKDTGDDQEEEEEGTEVALGPPPAYPTDLSPSPEMPGVPPPAPTAAIPPVVTKPPLTFALPPAVPPRALVPVRAPAPKKKAGFLGFGGSGVGAEKNKKITKEEFDDATELTRFALKALQEKDADLAVQRLKEALKYLGH